MTAPVTIIEAMEDPAIFGAAFRDGASWGAWRAFLKGVFALPMTAAELGMFQAYTTREAATTRAREAWMVVGRRGGKSRVAALLAVYLACFRNYRAILAPGEKGTVMLIAADRRQARVLMRYVAGALEGSPMLASLVVARTAESVELATRVVIEIHTASFRSVRGYTVVAALCDEIAVWRSEDAANPDVEILAALRPAMATVPGALLVCLSSPYARRGALWQAHREHYGRDGDPVLVWQADTRSMNPTVDEHVIAGAYASDAAAAAADYGAQFRSDLEDFVTPAVVERVVIPGRRPLPRDPGVRKYVAFVDPAGGSGGDSMTLAVAHVTPHTAVLDLVLEVRPPFSPEAAVAHFAEALRPYDVRRVVGDRYAGEWPREAFRRQGITYEPAEHTKSQLYGELQPLLNSAGVELLDEPRLVAQLCGLERRTAWAGRDSIDHGPGGHDDVINAAAGALVLAARTAPRPLAGAALPPGVRRVGEPAPLGAARGVNQANHAAAGRMSGPASWISRQYGG